MNKLKTALIWLSLPLFLASCSNVESDANLDLTKTLDKTTFVWFVASWCPHCKAELPVYEEFYKENKTKVNMQLIVEDWKKMSWDYTIPQDISNPTSYEELTWEKCEYVPSYVILDKDKKVVDKQCWAKLSKEDLTKKLINNDYSSWETLTWTKTTLENNTKKDMNFSQTAWFQEWDLWVIMTTSNGKIEIRLFQDKAPKTVLNFLALAKKWYYTNTTFHRVIKNFMIQWWDPTATWMWGESIYGKEFEDEFSSDLSNLTWSLSMANAWTNTNWSQFFINQVANTYLDNKHTVFGQVVTWMDNVDKIASVKVDSNDKPTKDVKIIKMEVVKYLSWSLKAFDYNYEDELKKLQDNEAKKQESNKDRVVKNKDKISVNYILTNTDTKEKLDSSYDRGTPIDFTVWSGMMITGFDKAVIWMKIWEKKTVNLKPSEAYWEYDEKNVQTVKKSDLKSFEDAWYKLVAWTKLPTQYGELLIKSVTDSEVVLDINPPLAGKNLTFEIEMVKFDN